MRDRLTARREPLALVIGVRIPVPQYASKALTAMHGSCKAEKSVRLRLEA